MNIDIRWFVRADLMAVLEIERASFEFPWRGEDFIRAMRHKQVIGYVVREHHKPSIIGHMVWQFRNETAELLTIAVRPDYRRCGIATAMVDTMLPKMRGRAMAMGIRESNLEAQLWAKALGFSCVGINVNAFIPVEEDEYVFVRRPQSKKGTPCPARAPKS